MVSSRFIKSVDRLLIGTNTTGKSGLGSDDNERVLHTPGVCETGASLSYAV